MALFADTFYFIALFNRDDNAHVRSSEYASKPVELVTTTWVLAELGDGLSDTQWRSFFPVFLSRLRSNARVTILPPTGEQFEQGVQLYAQLPDKEWSLTDCISFAVMQDQKLTEALTGDHHFEQAGFVALLK